MDYRAAGRIGHTPQSLRDSSPNLGEQLGEVVLSGSPSKLEGVAEHSSDGGVCHVVEECVKKQDLCRARCIFRRSVIGGQWLVIGDDNGDNMDNFAGATFSGADN